MLLIGLGIVALIATSYTTLAQEDAKRSIADQNDLLVRFFGKQGLAIIVDSKSQPYDPLVLDKMEKYMELDENDVGSLNLNGKINTFIYETELKKLPQDLVDRERKAIMRALDFIVPDCSTEQIYANAKADLKRFYQEQPDLAKELLDRVNVYLAADELHTEEATRFLRNFYYHWIPLGRLSKYIDTKAG